MKFREKSYEKFAPSSPALYNIGAQTPQGFMNEKVRWNQIEMHTPVRWLAGLLPDETFDVYVRWRNEL